jgi:hypothetical protein
LKIIYLWYERGPLKNPSLLWTLSIVLKKPSKITTGVYLVSEKCQYLRSELTDFRSKTSFGSVNKFYQELWKTWMRFDCEIFIKKALKMTDVENNKLSKILWGEESSRISKTIVWESWDHPSSIPVSVFVDIFVKLKIASTEPWRKDKTYIYCFSKMLIIFFLGVFHCF